jgi:chaperonin GroES
MKFTPLEDRILVRPTVKKELEKTESGIIIPESVKKEVAEGEVVSVGQGRYAMETGQFIPNYLYPGDIILFGASQGMSIDVGGEELRIMREGDVLLIIGRKEKNDGISEN